MIPCHVCGKDTTGGWTHGFIPSPDSLKVGLCSKHDSPGERLHAMAAWRKLMEREVADLAVSSAHRAGGPGRWLLRVSFMEGGYAETPCLACEPDGQGALVVHLIDGTLRFFPVSRIRHWDLTPQGALPPEVPPSAAPSSDN